MLSNKFRMLSKKYHVLLKDYDTTICCVRNFICCVKSDNIRIVMYFLMLSGDDGLWQKSGRAHS